MDTWPGLALVRFEASHAQNGDKMRADAGSPVLPTLLFVPELASFGIAGGPSISAGVQKRDHGFQRTVRQGEDAGLEELRFADRDGPGLYIHIPEFQPGDLADPQPGTIGQNEDRIEIDGA